MSPKTLASRRSIDSCTIQLHSWKPFSPNSTNPNPKTLDSDSFQHCHTTKRPCLSDRATSFSLSVIDALDISKLSLFEDDNPYPASAHAHNKDRYRWMARKRRRRGSRSVSGRSSDRSGTRNGRCCSVGATATCSDFMLPAGGTDSSGELFVNVNGIGSGEGNWSSSDVSDARNSRRDRRCRNGIADREYPGSGLGFDAQCSESGYGSEPGYRGDAEFGYGDEVDEEDDDARFLLWGDTFQDPSTEMIGESMLSEQKIHYRGRRRKNDMKVVMNVAYKCKVVFAKLVFVNL